MFPQFMPQALSSPAFKSHFENLITLYTDMSQRTLEAMQSLSELNMQLARDLIAEAGANTQRLMASKDASQLGSSIAAQFTPGSNALQNYQRRLTEIISRTNSSLAQTAATHMPAVRRSATGVAEEFVNRASEQTARASEKMAQYQAGSQMRH
jgi:phasin family protein